MFSSFHKDKWRKNKMEQIKIYRNIIKLKNIQMFYLDTKTEGPVIICLHGLWGRAETWVE